MKHAFIGRPIPIFNATLQTHTLSELTFIDVIKRFQHTIAVALVIQKTTFVFLSIHNLVTATVAQTI